MFCDFCYSTRVTWSYPCESFEFNPLLNSIGNWAACDICHDLIECGDDIALMNRAIETADIQGIFLPKDLMLEFHNMFREHRIGEAIQYA